MDAVRRLDEVRLRSLSALLYKICGGKHGMVKAILGAAPDEMERASEAQPSCITSLCIVPDLRLDRTMLPHDRPGLWADDVAFAWRCQASR